MVDAGEGVLVEGMPWAWEVGSRVAGGGTVTFSRGPPSRAVVAVMWIGGLGEREELAGVERGEWGVEKAEFVMGEWERGAGAGISSSPMSGGGEGGGE